MRTIIAVLTIFGLATLGLAQVSGWGLHLDLGKGFSLHYREDCKAASALTYVGAGHAYHPSNVVAKCEPDAALPPPLQSYQQAMPAPTIGINGSPIDQYLE